MKYSEQPSSALCPACGLSSGTINYRVTSEMAAAHFISSNNCDATHRNLVDTLNLLWGQDFCEVISCANCEFDHAYPFVAGNEDFYNLAFGGGGYPKWKWEFEIALDIISKSGVDTPLVLEIGAGDGHFLGCLLRGVTTVENLFAVEISRGARESIAEMGIPRIFGDLSDLDALDGGGWRGKFDFVVAFQVLEHLDGLDEFLGKLHHYLAEHGEILFAVPNNHWIRFSERNGSLLNMPPNHLGNFSASSIFRLAQRNGFEVVELSYEPAKIMPSLRTFLSWRLLQTSKTSKSRIVLFLVSEESFFWKKVAKILWMAVDAVVHSFTLVRFCGNLIWKGGHAQFFRLKKAVDFDC